jgi:hypothetical protein
MALIIEDGNIVSNANSYVTLAEARAFALARGVTLSAVDATLEPFVIKAMDFLESLRSEYQGTKISKDQRLQWPRTGVVCDGFDIADDEIPTVLKDAQCQLIVDGSSGSDLLPNSDGREVIREKIDVLETEYAPSSSGGTPSPTFTKALALLQPLFEASASGVFLTTSRI